MFVCLLGMHCVWVCVPICLQEDIRAASWVSGILCLTALRDGYAEFATYSSGRLVIDSKFQHLVQVLLLMPVACMIVIMGAENLSSYSLSCRAIILFFSPLVIPDKVFLYFRPS